MSNHPIVFAGLMPHAPLLVPEVGHERQAECRRTREACARLARRAAACVPERLVVVSSRAPRRRRAFGVSSGVEIHGDLSRFGAPHAAVRWSADAALHEALTGEAARAGLCLGLLPPTAARGDDALDHGSVVPLRFLAEAGLDVPLTVLALPQEEDPELLRRFGRALAAAAAASGGRTALVASGDCTHRALPDAPAGYHPLGAAFDLRFAEGVVRGRLDVVSDLDPGLREVAAEDAVASTTLVAAALGFDRAAPRLLSYEHPFGVGYLVAVLHDGIPPGVEALPAIARLAIRARLLDLPFAPRDAPRGRLSDAAAVFVTLRDAAGGLRGCAGSPLAPLFPNLVAEVADRSVAAAFHDPRFAPLTLGELDACSIEIAVLDEPVAVVDVARFDPRVLGLEVADEAGRRAVLLPDAGGVSGAAEQIARCRRRAGIAAGAPLRVRSFRAELARES